MQSKIRGIRINQKIEGWEIEFPAKTADILENSNQKQLIGRL